jgi:2-dehydro-3-deoxyphosphooctonate aldolase (KDO 8-P synthase)
MTVRTVTIAPGYTIGAGAPPLFFAGPCVIESRAHSLAMAGRLKAIGEETGARIAFKSSWDKANRSSKDSFRGPGLSEGLDILAEVKAKTGLPVLSDIHEPGQAEAAARVPDVLQIPAFLSRQTDLLVAAAETGKPLNIKKGQFLAPDDMANVVEKCRAAGNENLLLCERGTSFGYHNLVVDMRSFPIMRALGFPVVYDVTHSLQLPGGGKETGGQKQYARPPGRWTGFSSRSTTTRTGPCRTARPSFPSGSWRSCSVRSSRSRPSREIRADEAGKDLLSFAVRLGESE